MSNRTDSRHGSADRTRVCLLRVLFLVSLGIYYSNQFLYLIGLIN